MNAPLHDFEPTQVPLAGVHLVEAAAGTGKTHNLTELYVRLVAEAGFAAREIVVVTFTEAATQELRGRVRTRLSEVRDALSRNLPSVGPGQGFAHVLPDPTPALSEHRGGRFLANVDVDAETTSGLSRDAAPEDALAVALRAREAEPGQARLRVEAALAGFDEAVVSTIHGFCRRALEDDAHLGSEGPLALDPDGVEEIRRAAVADWWRRVMNAETEEDPAWVLEQWSDPDALIDELNPAWRVDASALVPATPFDREATRARLEAQRREGQALHACGEFESLRAVLADPLSPLSRNRTESPYAPEALGAHAAAVCAWLQGGDALAAPADALAAFCRASILGRVHKPKQGKWTLPPSRVCDWAERAAACASDTRRARVVAMRHAALAAGSGALARRRSRTRTRTLDALITDLRDALHGVDGDSWTARMRGRYRAAIVDEFQDTDARQYAIFKRVFGAGESPCLFLIGDPKQSIYRFRGADVFAYAEAARDAGDNRWTLRDNWRADARLVEALNALFDHAPAPFLFDFIGFTPSRVPPARRLEKGTEGIKGAETPSTASEETAAPSIPSVPFSPLEFALVAAPDGKTMNKPAVAELVLPWLADRIARSIERDATVGARTDIAVLVSSNKQIDEVSRALADLGVPHFALGRGSVFETRDARELAVVLAALTEAADARRWRAALLTDLLGASIATLQAANEGSPAWLESLARRERLLALWRDDGVAALTRALAIDAAPRLLARGAGERRLANLAHLGELLQAASQRHDTSTALLAWLERQIRELAQSETTELRPASDDAPVRIMTVHRCKGLQFDTVYVPYLWDTHDQPLPEGRPIAYHDAEDGLRVDLGGGAWAVHAALYASEERAETLRLGYVALTRARHRTTAVLAPTKGYPRSATARWLRQTGDGEDGIATADITARVAALATRADGRIAVTTVTTPAAQIALQAHAPAGSLTARPFRATIDRSDRSASFSSLVREEAAQERPDYDEASGTVEVVDTDGPIGAWPRGKHVGVCVHAVLERLDFARWPDARSLAMLEDTARRHGFDARAVEVFRDWIERLVDAEIVPGLRLPEIAADRRPPELEFFFALTAGGREQLARALAGWPRHARTPQEWQRLAPRWQGLMHGYIDLVFEHEGRYYILDYKTNFLGTRAEDYADAALRRAVRNDAYDLQYLIYLIALHRHLRFRLGARFDPARHLGGAVYVFLRGLAAGPGFGIYRDCPDPALIAALDTCFGGRGGVTA